MTKQIQSLEGIISTDRSDRGDEPEIKKLKENGLYQVQSFSNPNASYVVDLFSGTCSCPHFQIRGVQCKHIHAVKAKLSWEAFERAGVIL